MAHREAGYLQAQVGECSWDEGSTMGWARGGGGRVGRSGHGLWPGALQEGLEKGSG